MVNLNVFLPNWFEECFTAKTMLDEWAADLKQWEVARKNVDEDAPIEELQLIDDVQLIALWQLNFGDVPDLPRETALLESLSVDDLTRDRLERRARGYCSLWLKSRGITATVNRLSAGMTHTNPYPLVLAASAKKDIVNGALLIGGRILDPLNVVENSYASILINVQGIKFPSNFGFSGWDELMEEFEDLVRNLWPAWLHLNVEVSVPQEFEGNKLSELAWLSCPLDRGFTLKSDSGPLPSNSWRSV